ncbi:MAG TPA: biopolymer transporter ExbD [Ferruginibacter sp.]|jgi:biopolymer transport protein ExbD|nr:biopolymer transporter ExbD [Ferruginibacter sp.]
MPRAKIPRKSTNVDMTAMCDVAFLLLSFFILATKQKPPEVVQINTPSSVSTKIAKTDAVLVTLTKDGKVYLSIGDNAHKNDVIDGINRIKSLNLTPDELAKLKKQDFIGEPFSKLKNSLDLAAPIPAAEMDGIPTDSTDNELVDWIASVSDAYRGEDISNLNLLVKGDNAAFYSSFKNIKDAFAKNEIYKFKVVTNAEGIPAGSELALNPEANK